MADIGLQVVIGVFSLVAVSLSGYSAYKGNTKAKEIETKAAPYEAMSSHVVTLTNDVTELREQVAACTADVWQLRSDQWEDRTYTQRMAAAWDPGRPLPQPMPAWLSVHFGLPPASPFSPNHPPPPTPKG